MVNNTGESVTPNAIRCTPMKTFQIMNSFTSQIITDPCTRRVGSELCVQEGLLQVSCLKIIPWLTKAKFLRHQENKHKQKTLHAYSMQWYFSLFRWIQLTTSCAILASWLNYVCFSPCKDCDIQAQVQESRGGVAASRHWLTQSTFTVQIN